VSTADREFYPIKTIKRGTVLVARNVAGPPPLGWGVSFSEIKQTLNKHEQSEEVAFDDVKVRLYLRHLTSDGGVDCYALVPVRAGRSQVADVAARIYPDLCDDLDQRSPLDVLKQFVERFGVEFTIGGQTGTLFCRQTIEIDRRHADRAIVLPTDRNTSLWYFGARRDDRLAIALAACVDVTAYTQWLAGR